jgi:hypothetical protein
MNLVIVVAVACFLGGVMAASRWLPDLAPGPIATLTFFVVCGLFGAALGVFGVNVDNLVRAIEGGGPGDLRADVVANILAVMLRDTGILVGLALLLLLLAPKPVSALAAGGEEPEPTP